MMVGMVVMLVGEFGSRLLRNQVVVCRRVTPAIVLDVWTGHTRSPTVVDASKNARSVEDSNGFGTSNSTQGSLQLVRAAGWRNYLISW